MFKTLIRNLRKKSEQDALDAKVREALENAAENGCTFAGWTNTEVATDMCTYDADLETHEVEEVTAALSRVRGAQYDG